MILMGLGNLLRSRLRTFLTLLGVVVGIGALSSMMSLGTGIRKNFTDAFAGSDLFTSFTVFPAEISPDAVLTGNMDIQDVMAGRSSVPLNDSAVNCIVSLPGVELVVPDIIFPARLRFLGKETQTRVQVLPPEMGVFPPFNRLRGGSFFSSEISNHLIIREEELAQLGITLYDKKMASPDIADSTGKSRPMPVDSVIGMTIELVTMVIDPSKFQLNPLNVQALSEEHLLREHVTLMQIEGIVEKSNMYAFNRFRGDVMIAPARAGNIPRVGFDSVWDLLKPGSTMDTYPSLYVRVKDLQVVQEVKEKITEMGFSVFYLADRLDEFKRQFLIVQSLLGAIGFIALFVAALGIINTMVMTILERVREIGIMKSIGARDQEVRWIFFTEAGTEPVDLFYFPLWLLAGSVAFSVLVSLAAGLYPAVKASRIDPVKALRHD